MNPRLTEAPSWRALQARYEKVKDIQLRQLSAADLSRGDRLAVAKAAPHVWFFATRRPQDGNPLTASLASAHRTDLSRCDRSVSSVIQPR
jgi:hypothetical protein